MGCIPIFAILCTNTYMWRNSNRNRNSREKIRSERTITTTYAYFRRKLKLLRVFIVKDDYSISHYLAVHTGCDFALIFLIPFGLIVHNYVRISMTLFRSLREGERLKEGTDNQWVTLMVKIIEGNLIKAYNLIKAQGCL